jgi:hypothetical protein
MINIRNGAPIEYEVNGVRTQLLNESLSQCLGIE